MNKNLFLAKQASIIFVIPQHNLKIKELQDKIKCKIEFKECYEMYLSKKTKDQLSLEEGGNAIFLDGFVVILIKYGQW